MRFPFVTRAHHETVVTAMKQQLEGLAKLLYPRGVPQEFQLLLGIQIEASANQPEPEPELTDDQKAMAEMKAQQAADRARLERIRRTRPSQLGAALSDYMRKWSWQKATGSVAPSPVSSLFARAEAEALNTDTTSDA